MMDYDEDFADEVWYSTNSTSILESSSFLYVMNFFVFLSRLASKPQHTEVRDLSRCSDFWRNWYKKCTRSYAVPYPPHLAGWYMLTCWYSMFASLVLLYQWSQIATTRMWRWKKDDAHDMRMVHSVCAISVGWMQDSWLDCHASSCIISFV